MAINWKIVGNILTGAATLIGLANGVVDKRNAKIDIQEAVREEVAKQMAKMLENKGS